MEYQSGRQFAVQCDLDDPLKRFRDLFHLPQRNGHPVIYFCGNSLGLQPRSVSRFVSSELESWADLGVEGHFDGQRPWMPYHKNFKSHLAELVGAQENEVVAMNSLTTNLHLLMVSFYRPCGKRYKIICEAGAFPSDQYALETQVKFHGYSPGDAIVELDPADGSHLLSTDDILAKINEVGDELALVIMGGVQYYTGQLFDMETITRTTHAVGAVAAFDLAHAVGNVPVKLHDWAVDFAVWCSYKYLNSGPGAVGGAFVNEKHHNADLPQFGGWWGHNEEERFLMKSGFKPISGADRWQLSNAPIFNMAAHLASLEIFHEAGVDNLRLKSINLTGYLEYLIKSRLEDRIEVITPTDPDQRGCQLSLFVEGGGRSLFERLLERGVISDWREPNVIRIAPVPLYNTYVEVFDFIDILEEELNRK